jgi:hypothetical protein
VAAAQRWLRAAALEVIHDFFAPSTGRAATRAFFGCGRKGGQAPPGLRETAGHHSQKNHRVGQHGKTERRSVVAGCLHEETFLMTDDKDSVIKAIVKVGDGRGFVVQGARERRYVITAAHCLPHLPPAFGHSYLEERTYPRLLGPLADEPTIWAECLFVDLKRRRREIRARPADDARQCSSGSRSSDGLVQAMPASGRARSRRTLEEVAGDRINRGNSNAGTGI